VTESQTHPHPPASALERRITIVAVALPFAGFIAALWLLWGGFVTGRDLAILAVMYVLVGFGVTIGFHRMLTHRSFEAKPWLRATFAILGSMSVQVLSAVDFRYGGAVVRRHRGVGYERRSKPVRSRGSRSRVARGARR
jgi:fatty-acid desaturase